MSNEAIPGLLICRPESSLVYFNVDQVNERILALVRSEVAPPRLVLLDLSAAPRVDLQSAEALAGLAEELRVAGIPLRVVEAHATVREQFRLLGLKEKLGPIDRLLSLASAVKAFEDSRSET